MTPVDIALLVLGGVLALTAIAVVVRMIIGPTILDRAVATDMLVVLLVLALALYTAHAHAAWAVPSMLTLTGLAFIGTVTFARFVAREDPARPGRRTHGEASSTGGFRALDLEQPGRVAGWEDGDGPEGADGANTWQDVEVGEEIPVNAHEDADGGPGPEAGDGPRTDVRDPDDDHDDEDDDLVEGFGREEGPR
ncbi:monovalent cation/H+ antiporter complex subunit F [Brachybacterium sp. NBEC-018]|uniref:monovalent cation/H+ antiporter complex subunit F n=1 Tax=Brachybacterium sp. NBEC-018 TaxID=2996004 RepID=UPI0021753D32|nr:monovalent cation/H+ antiporter complex subunit F [Brachybacterium sp. NBEC-018]UVY85306.1 monovalent cation/H+ antiporter complex subunit F [Brachybacterium sp. NBEC-018]